MYGVRVFGGSAISPVGLNTPRGYGYFARWAQYASAVCPTPCPRPTGRGWRGLRLGGA